ncbi:MAG TPA: alpha/beta fold hydrolase [Mobilitalea sp.]|nr:alpha/beta fold hydrolase [Mobilitalea sp.]
MSEVTYISIKQKDGYITKLTYYVSPNKPKASILILHGMAEHQKRYQSYANYLVNCGYDVYSYDHRGHGNDTKLSDLGFFSPENGYQLIIADVISVCAYIEQNNRSSKFFLLGHSMGSILARNVIQTYDRFNGVILSGTPHPPKFMTSFGLFIASFIKKFKGPKHISPFLSNLMCGNKKYTSLSTRTAYDWLSRSNSIVGAYIHDPYCGFTCTASFYHDFLKLIQNATKKKQIRLTRKDLPIYIISGEKDPVGNYGKDVNKFLSLLKKCEFSNVSLKLYPECRHELLNELNNEEVYTDIQQWISKRI